MRFGPVSYMRWAKEHLEAEGIHNLGSSGVLGLLRDEDLRDTLDGLPFWGHNEDGLPALKEAIAARYGVPADRVLLATGTSLANFLVLAAWIRPGDRVLVEQPHYEPLGAVLRALGARIVPAAIDEGEGHAALLRRLRGDPSGRARAVVLTNPQNPTGRILGEELLDRLDAVCAATGACLFVDEAYREILFEDPPGCAARGRTSVVATSSLTKVFGLSHLRIGWGIGPPELIRRAVEIHDNLGVVHPYITEAIGARILSDRSRLERWRLRLRARVERNRDTLAGFLAAHPSFEGAAPEAGILAFPRWLGRPGLEETDRLCERARLEANVVLVPGRFFQRPDRVRFGVGGPEEAVAGALRAFDRFLDGAGAEGGER